ncbi:MAG TPA: transposase [Methanolinea sp.]|nr:transposase [Methanolinea sp.]
MDRMDFREIGRLVSDDRIALEYFWKKRELTICPFCDSSEFYFIGRNRVRCKECRKDLWPLQGTRFSSLRIAPSQWLSLIKLFELSVSARKASQDIHLSYKTTLRAYDILRMVLVEELARTDAILKGELEANEAYFGGKRKGKRGRGVRGKTIVFGILERGERITHFAERFLDFVIIPREYERYNHLIQDTCLVILRGETALIKDQEIAILNKSLSL